MMVKIVNKLLSLTWVGDIAEMINGNKTLIGLLALVVHVLNLVPTYLPEYGIAVTFAAKIQDALLWMGVLLPVGAAHKVGKAIEERNNGG